MINDMDASVAIQKDFLEKRQNAKNSTKFEFQMLFLKKSIWPIEKESINFIPDELTQLVEEIQIYFGQTFKGKVLDFIFLQGILIIFKPRFFRDLFQHQR